MLTIPSTVAALLERESVPKNFRVTFPNGEMADLTNVNLLRESVKFTESICSRQSFRFGLAESSVLEFETVGVADMRGLTIQCFCEVCVNSLTSAEISAIQAGTWDGELVLSGASDIGYAYFRIPYGTFVIAECPRNQEAMARRKVKAYSVDYFAEPNPFEAVKLSATIQWPGAVYSPYVAPLALAQTSQGNDAPILSAGYTKTTSTYTPLWEAFRDVDGVVVEVKNSSGDTLQLQVTQVISPTPVAPSISDSDFKDIRGVHIDKAHLRAYVAAIDAVIEGLDIDYDVPATLTGSAGSVSVPVGGPADVRALVGGQYQVYDGVLYTQNAELGKAWLYNSFEPFWWFSTTFGESVDCRVTAELLDYSTGASGDYTYYTWGVLDRNQQDSFYNFGGMCIPKGYKLTVTNVTAGTSQTYSDTLIKFADVGKLRTYYYSPPGSGPMLTDRLSFNPNGNELGVSSFTGAYDTAKIVNDFLELQALFASPARIGSTEFFRPDSSSPVAALPSDYRSFWWDEYSATAVGRVRFLLGQDSNDLIVDYVFGNGPATYDMTDNTLMRDMGYSQQEAVAFLTSNLIPYLSGLTLDTVELEARGRPQVESGDFLTVTAEDGSTFLACVTRRELTGIQVLTDDIETVGFQAGVQGRAARTYTGATPVAGSRILYNSSKVGALTPIQLADAYANYDMLVISWITNIDVFFQVIDVATILSGRNYFTYRAESPGDSLWSSAYVNFPSTTTMQINGVWANNPNWTLGIFAVRGIKF